VIVNEITHGPLRAAERIWQLAEILAFAGASEVEIERAAFESGRGDGFRRAPRS
jgi:hypothetical protein